MKEYKRVEQVVFKDIPSGIYCDKCGKTIGMEQCGQAGKRYYEVITGHNNWGNSSHESIKNLDFCSYECLTEHQNDYFSNTSGSAYYEIKLDYAKQ